MNTSSLPALAAQEEPAPALESETAAVLPMTVPAETQDEDPWGVWPYIWFIDLHAFSRLRFHSFHRRFRKWRLERHNRRRQKQFWAGHRFRPAEDELGLELL
jgi:hypothetical protein